MQVADQKVVSIDYKLTDNDGQVIDTSEGAGPLNYLHGVGNLIPGLEAALLGKSAGENVQVKIPPEQGYGVRNEQLKQVVARDNFDPSLELQAGMQFRVPAEEGGHEMVVTVVGVEGDKVTVDGNHQLAGVELNFDVTIRDIREATPQELEHGHAHNGGADH